MNNKIPKLEPRENKELPPEILFRILACMYGEEIARVQVKELIGIKIGEIVQEENEDVAHTSQENK